jgi:hypothetical protein
VECLALAAKRITVLENQPASASLSTVSCDGAEYLRKIAYPFGKTAHVAVFFLLKNPTSAAQSSFGTMLSVYTLGEYGNVADALVATGWIHVPGTVPLSPEFVQALLQMVQPAHQSR